MFIFISSEAKKICIWSIYIDKQLPNANNFLNYMQILQLAILKIMLDFFLMKWDLDYFLHTHIIPIQIRPSLESCFGEAITCVCAGVYADVGVCGCRRVCVRR